MTRSFKFRKLIHFLDYAFYPFIKSNIIFINSRLDFNFSVSLYQEQMIFITISKYGKANNPDEYLGRNQKLG